MSVIKECIYDRLWDDLEAALMTVNCNAYAVVSDCMVKDVRSAVWQRLRDAIDNVMVVYQQDIHLTITGAEDAVGL